MRIVGDERQQRKPRGPQIKPEWVMIFLTVLSVLLTALGVLIAYLQLMKMK